MQSNWPRNLNPQRAAAAAGLALLLPCSHPDSEQVRPVFRPHPSPGDSDTDLEFVIRTAQFGPHSVKCQRFQPAAEDFVNASDRWGTVSSVLNFRFAKSGAAVTTPQRLAVTLSAWRIESSASESDPRRLLSTSPDSGNTIRISGLAQS